MVLPTSIAADNKKYYVALIKNYLEKQVKEEAMVVSMHLMRKCSLLIEIGYVVLKTNTTRRIRICWTVQ